MKTNYTKAALATLLIASAGWGWGCDEDVDPPTGDVKDCEALGTCQDNKTDPPVTDDEEIEVIKLEYPVGDEVRPVRWPIEEPSNPGFAEAEEASAPGALHGGWRIGTADANDAPVAYLDLTQAEGDDAPTCSFMLGGAVDPALQGQYGRCSNATFSQGTLNVEFAPTPQSEQSWRLSLVEEGEGWRGVLSEYGDSITPLEVTMTRRQVADAVRVPPNAIR